MGSVLGSPLIRRHAGLAAKVRWHVNKHVARQPWLLNATGMALTVVDAYGAPGDTLQAVRGHAFAPLLANPGEQDLTSHVDFEALTNAASGVAVTRILTQGEWLERVGVGARAEALVRANPARSDDVHAARERLTARDQMGGLFKVVALHAADWPAPAGFA